MDIKKLLLFADVAETENFTKTGDRMGYTQSGVSHLLKSLEDEIGFPLFIRSKQGVKLTGNAKMILPGVRSLLAMTEHLEQMISKRPACNCNIFQHFHSLASKDYTYIPAESPWDKD